jgi:hypothetical protein
MLDTTIALVFTKEVTMSLIGGTLRGLASFMIGAGSATILLGMPRSVQEVNALPSFPKRNSEVWREKKVFLIYIRNNCKEPVNVAIIRYYPGNTGGGHGRESDITLMTPSSWNPEGWWKIWPGQVNLIAEQRYNRNLYFYAETTGQRQHIWSSQDSVKNFQGRNLGFKRFDMGNQFGPYRLTLNCN